MDALSYLLKQGYAIFPKMLSEAEVIHARKQLTNIFSTESVYPGDINNDPKVGNIYIDPFTRHSELRWILFNTKIISALKSILGDDFVIVPEMAIHDSGYGG